MLLRKEPHPWIDQYQQADDHLEGVRVSAQPALALVHVVYFNIDIQDIQDQVIILTAE